MRLDTAYGAPSPFPWVKPLWGGAAGSEAGPSAAAAGSSLRRWSQETPDSEQSRPPPWCPRACSGAGGPVGETEVVVSEVDAWVGKTQWRNITMYGCLKGC